MIDELKNQERRLERRRRIKINKKTKNKKDVRVILKKSVEVYLGKLRQGCTFSVPLVDREDALDTGEEQTKQYYTLIYKKV